MEKAKIRPLDTPKPLNRSSQKLAGVITFWTEPGMQNFVAIGLRVTAPQIRDFAEPLGWLVFLLGFWGGFFNGYSLHPWTDIYAKYVKKFNDVPGKGMPFGGLDDYIFYLDP